MKMNEGKLAVVLRVLEEEFKDIINGFNILGFVHQGKTAIVELCNVTYFIWDNGGELGIKKVNSEGLSKRIPLSSFNVELDPLTIAHRCKQCFNNKPIDYNFNEDEQKVESYLEFLGVKNEDTYKIVY